jgi:hypothetical protein
MNAITAHELVGVDGNGLLCACLQPFTVEHLGAVALVALNAPPSVDESRYRERREHTDRQTVRRGARRILDMAGHLTRTLALLDTLQAEQEDLAVRLAATGLMSFADQADWLIANDPYNVWRRK